MLFNSLIFPIFFSFIIIVYYQLNHRWQNRWLLVSSYFFYGWWDWRFCSLLVFSTTLDWFVSHALNKTKQRKRRKYLLLLSIFSNLGILGFFKYYNFFIDSLKGALSSISFQPELLTLSIILPVGISFYTFQTMAYTIDVYYKRIKPANDFIVFAIYVSYFPQLVAGPIERAKRLLPQIIKRRDYSYDNFRTGIALILFGYFKKVVIADSLSSIVETCFQDPSSSSGVDLLLGVYAFAIQIYCDFSGYTDIARGISRFLGIELVRNFSVPYFSRNITEFWRRWHMSLSSWLRDYLYIPLGGNKKSKKRTYINLMVTMIIGGLWHGANWTFVIWGGLHGFFLSVHKILLRGNKFDIKPWGSTKWGYLFDLIKVLLTFHLVCLAWIFFRAPSFLDANYYIKGIATNDGSITFLKPVLLGLFSMIAIDLGQCYKEDQLWLLQLPSYLRYVISVTVLIVIIIIFGYHYGGSTPFIYFQF